VIKYIKGILLLLVAAASLHVQGQKAQWVDGIIAVVGDKIILRSELETELANIQLDTVSNPADLPCLTLKNIVLQKLLLNQAELDSLPLSEERIEGELDNRIRYFQRQIGSQAAFEAYLGMSLAEYKDQLRPKLKAQLLAQEMQSTITADILLSPKDVKRYFDTIKPDMLPLVPSSLQVAQLMIEPEYSAFSKEFARGTLLDVRARLLKGESFERLAKLYSQDPGSKVEGGLLPEFSRGDMVPAFEREAYKLKPDSLSPVFESDFGYHIIKLVSRKGESIVAKHILIRPSLTSSDLAATAKLMDSLYKALKSGKADWCTVVKRHNKSKYNNPDYCGFMQDETTGNDKVFYETLSPDMKKEVDKLQPGQFSKPISTQLPQGGTIFYMVYFKELFPPHQANLGDDYDRIKILATEAKKQNAMNTWVETTLETTYLKINNRDINCPNLKLVD
jgi:peptidyl-prolyl cis-trans isomerase SurA